MRLPIVVGLARTEARTIRRLVRYWVFVALAAGTGFIAFLTVAAIHGFASTVSATVGQMGPRYIAAAYGFLYLIVFVVGLILLAFDVRSRDQRERIVEVLDTRPYSNLELVTGRLLGILVTAWLPVVGTVLAMELFGWVGRTLSWAVGGLIEPWSLLRLVVFMAIPTFAFMTALVFLLSLVVRYRFLTALLALTVVAVNVSAVSILGIDLNWVGDIFGGSGYNFASDLMPAVLTPAEYLQRLAVLVAAAGLVALAAAVHPRFDGRSRKRRAGAGVGLVLVALAMLGLLARHGLASRSRTEQWRTAHEARRDEPAADLEAIAGIVEVDPGHSLRMELEVGFAAPPNATLSTVLFTLNPGLVVERIADRAGGELAFNHQDGLLDVTLVTPLPAAGRTTLEMTIAGRPETAFGYLDSAIDPKTRPSEETAIIFLGIEPAIFDRHFVALMPGVRWLPAPGGEAGRDDGSQRPTDFFGLDLTVDLPAEWLAAGPGRRRESAEAAPGRVRYRFAPAAPVPEAAVIASRFVRRAFEVEGVELE
ncbi:MAG: hypothetical protein GY856_16535, partial [bacterium]|nr:hypothetical protein [bacterium]